MIYLQRHEKRIKTELKESKKVYENEKKITRRKKKGSDKNGL